MKPILVMPILAVAAAACGQPIDTDDPLDTGPVCELTDLLEPADRGRPMPPAGLDLHLLWPGANAPLADSDYACDDPAACDEVELDCEGNIPPIVGTPVFLVDGQIVGPIDEMLPSGSEYAYGIPFLDVDDNLGCGTLAYQGVLVEDADEEGGPKYWGTMPLCANMPCSSASSGLVIAYSRPVANITTTEAVRATVIDRCGAASETVRVAYSAPIGRFTVSYETYEPERYE